MLGAQMMQMMTQFAEPGQPDPIAEMFSEEKAKEKAASYGEGVEYVKTEMLDQDGKKGARVHYKFADISKITVTPGDAVEDLGGDAAPADAEAKDDESVKFSYADGKLKIMFPPTDFEDMTMEDGPEDPQQEAMMMQMMADMRLSVKLVVAPGIEETNATFAEGDTITLFDVQVGKMLAKKDELKKVSETAKTDVEAAKKAFNEIEGIKVETKEEVTVTLK